ncbi:hypothetical protein INT47_009372 [Mucor saturninus]|uniref:Yeast cell wall synthesis Kre9/Knh1-like N-terminal domain-containing protein n=1 Tax=Mucor saturninus TaxID=64648 RepID=A0A8H7R636_9FUNG|nr:hypothetical protein INT47_009372 [Mucor saturninus]
MKSIFAAIFAVAAAVASAQKIVSSRPASNQVIVAGASTQIVWAPVDGVISTIDLRKGDQVALAFLNTVATAVPATTGSYTWNVPADLAAGTDYALSFGSSPNDTYTPFFTIQAATGGAAAPASSAASAPAAAASSSAAVAPAASAAHSGKPSDAASASAAHSGKPAASASASGSAPAASTTSGANKNVAAVGAMAVAGAVAAALL